MVVLSEPQLNYIQNRGRFPYNCNIDFIIHFSNALFGCETKNSVDCK